MSRDLLSKLEGTLGWSGQCERKEGQLLGIKQRSRVLANRFRIAEVTFLLCV